MKQLKKNWIITAITDHQKQKSLPFIILDAVTNNVIGAIRVGNITEAHSRVEIGGTWICWVYQGTGINGQVKKLLFNYLFAETSFVWIEFKTDVLNISARKTMEKVGLVKEVVLRNHTLMTHNRRRDTLYYSVLKEEWIALNS